MDVLSIVKRRDSLGLLQHSDTEERFTQRRDEMNALLKICMGGLVAEESGSTRSRRVRRATSPRPPSSAPR